MPDAPRTPLRSIRIDDELWGAARDKAERDGTTVSEVVRAALREYVTGDLTSSA